MSLKLETDVIYNFRVPPLSSKASPEKIALISLSYVKSVVEVVGHPYGAGHQA